MVGQDVAHALARALAPQRHRHALAARLQRQHVFADRFEHIGARLGALGGKIAPGPRADIDHVFGVRHRERRQLGKPLRLQAPAPLAFRHIKPLGRQRLVRRRRALAQRLLARFIIIRDLRQAFMRGVFGQMFERQRRSRQIIEQRFHLAMEQRQPVLHAGMAPALAHRFVEHIVGRGRAELRDIAGAEAADGFRYQLEFRDRHQIEPAQLAFAALRLRIECTDRLQRVAEEIEPHRQVHAGREQIEDAAAHGVVARLAHGRGAGKAVELQPFDDAGHADDIAGRDRERMRGDKVARRHALQRGVDRREQHRRSVASFHARQTRQRGHALRHRAGIGRHAVVGQAIPGRKFHRQDVGPEERQRARQLRHALAVAADDAKRNRRRLVARRHRAREIGEHQAFGAVGHLRQGQRLACAQQFGGRFGHRAHVGAGPMRLKARIRRNSGLSRSAGSASTPFT